MDEARRRLAAVYRRQQAAQDASVPEDDALLALIRAHLPAGRPARVLDAGCGNGRYARTLAALGHRVRGLDLHPAVPARGFDYVRGDLGRLPFAAGVFDLVLCLSALYHLDDPRAATRELARVTAAGGRVLVTGHPPRAPQTLYRRVWLALGSDRFPNLRAVRRFPAAAEIAGWLAAEGLRVLAVDGYPRRRLRRVLRRRFLPASASMPPASAARASGVSWIRRFRSLFAYHLIVVAARAGSAR